mmetsp:Transcript_28014/g.82338  ORF Transcript_28014/g.82338 Transcript_28014/m.82338 type:complete len:262 (+) Transcript_28014:445-1230(+)
MRSFHELSSTMVMLHTAASASSAAACAMASWPPTGTGSRARAKRSSGEARPLSSNDTSTYRATSKGASNTTGSGGSVKSNPSTAVPSLHPTRAAAAPWCPPTRSTQTRTVPADSEKARRGLRKRKRPRSGCASAEPATTTVAMPRRPRRTPVAPGTGASSRTWNVRRSAAWGPRSLTTATAVSCPGSKTRTPLLALKHAEWALGGSRVRHATSSRASTPPSRCTPTSAWPHAREHAKVRCVNWKRDELGWTTKSLCPRGSA